MKKYPRFQEYKVLVYRILLAYAFYFIARVLFYVYNSSLIKVGSFTDFLELCYHGLAFDTTAILYVNGLFILLSIIPILSNTNKKFQNFLCYLYFVTNLLAYATNFIDFIYYRYTFSRSTIASLDTLENENNKILLFFDFVIHFWDVFLWFFILAFCWIYLYKKISVQHKSETPNVKYFGFSIVTFLVIVTLCIGGIRGDFKKSTRPINILDASRFVVNISQSDLVLNTPFAIIRTWDTNSFKKVTLVSKSQVDRLIVPIKYYKNNPATKPNIVIFIIESFAREYNGAFNKGTKIPNFQSYTPFVDSLAQHSMIFTNAYANGYKSIHGMSSVIAGIPSFENAFTSSPYPQQKIESLVSTLKSEGYDTSFFHGAPNGSMGFLGFGNILGYDHYYGKTEYNNDADFDGVWGIWDEPFSNIITKFCHKKNNLLWPHFFLFLRTNLIKFPRNTKASFQKEQLIFMKVLGTQTML